MNRLDLMGMPLRPSPFTGWAPRVHRVCFGLFLFCLGWVWIRVWLAHAPLGETHWSEGVLLLSATATLLAELCRQLPGQNVLLAAVVIGGMAGVVVVLGAATGIPFGPIVYDQGMGPRLLRVLPCGAPLIWIVAVICSRGVAQLMLRRWRQTPNYGLWLMALTAALVVFMDLGLEPFAIQVAHLWYWNPSRIQPEWYTAPWVTFLGWGGTALLLLVLAAPALINKRPGSPAPPSYHPLIVWLLINLLFVTGAVRYRLWAAVVVVAVGSVVITASILFDSGLKRSQQFVLRLRASSRYGAGR
jgi:uncharacterized membrane protein